VSKHLEPISDERQREIREEYAARRTRQIMIAVVFGVVFLTFFAVRYAGGVGRMANVAAVGFLVLVVGAAWFSFTNWRCPACEKYLGRSLVWKFCPHCGVQLR
jgi:hypothetical protein